MLSQFKLVSIGIVAEDKEKDSNDILVLPIEITPDMADGAVSAVTEPATISGQDATGNEYSVSVTFSNVLTAQWLPVGNHNRLSSPDLVKNEKVYLYRFADTDQYFWVPTNLNNEFRKTETVFYGWAAEADPTIPLELGVNIWLLEISTDKGYFEFTTTQANGEKYTYSIKLDTTTGSNLMIIDSDENQVELNSEETRITLKNADETEVTLEKEELRAYAKTHVNLVSEGTLNAEVSKAVTIKCDDTVDAKIKGVTTIDCESKVFMKAPEMQFGEDGAVQPSVLGNSHAASHMTIETMYNAHFHMGNLGVPTSTPVVPMSVPNATSVSGADYSKVNTNQ